MVPSLAPSFLRERKKRIIGIYFRQKNRSRNIAWHYLRSSMTLACSLSSLISTKRLENFRPRASVIWLLMTACLRRSTDSCERENNCQNNTFKIWDSLRGGRYDKIWNFLMVRVIQKRHLHHILFYFILQILLYTFTLSFKNLGLVRFFKFLKEVSYAHQGCFFVTKNTVQTVNIITI